MLIYSPIQDAKHCAYRFLSTLHLSNNSEFRWDAFKLIDLYRLYPKLILNIKPFPRELSKLKKALNKIPTQYALPQDPRKTLFQIQPMHNLVVNWLIAKGFLSKQRFAEGAISRTNLEIPQELLSSFQKDELLQSDWFQTLIADMPNATFNGDKGIKQRTGYMEYRYDPK